MSKCIVGFFLMLNIVGKHILDFHNVILVECQAMAIYNVQKQSQHKHICLAGNVNHCCLGIMCKTIACFLKFYIMTIRGV